MVKMNYRGKADSGFPVGTGFVCGKAPGKATVLREKIIGIICTRSFA
jgi:hypothetical protein